MEADITLLQAARRMDREALAKIFDRYVNVLYNYAINLCNDPLTADFIVGNVFAKLVDQLACGSGPTTNLRSYLFETTYHLIIDEARYSNRRTSLDIVDLLPYDEYSTFLEAENRDLFERAVRVIQSELTVYQRHVIFLRFMEGFSLYETATILGKSVNIIKATQNRALGNLRKVLMASESHL
jgi:RNA polymerase sigma-70 factor (ECF subfamily)